MPDKPRVMNLALIAAILLSNPLVAVEEPDRPAKKPRVRRMRLDKTQPWLRADQVSVSTVNGAPKIRIRLFNENEAKSAESIKVLGSGTARDEFGNEYKAFTLSMVDTLEPRKSFHADYSLLPKLTAKTKALLLLLAPLEKRVMYVQLQFEKESWQIEEYGVWKDEKAYLEQSEWVADRKKENPFKDAAAVVRMWKDQSGDFSVEASFVDFKVNKANGKNIVSLKRADNGKTIKVSHATLSAEDRKYIRELKKKQREP